MGISSKAQESEYQRGLSPSASYPSPSQIALERARMTQAERLGNEPGILSKELLDLLDLALRQFRADIRPDRAMELVQGIVTILKLEQKEIRI